MAIIETYDGEDECRIELKIIQAESIEEGHL